MSSEIQIPSLTVHWFHAIDAPIKDPVAIRIAKRDKSIASKKSTATPKNWLPFSKRDNVALETAYKSGSTTTVQVNEDYLFEVNIPKREISPIYWEGPTFYVRRATWFMQGDGGASKWIPCEENMANQIEQGYLKNQPYIKRKIEEEKDMDLGDRVIEKEQEEPAIATLNEDERENLTEPYAGQYVVYTSQTRAWLLYDTTSAKITKSFLTKLTNNQNLGGTRLIRGYQQVQQNEKNKATTTTQPPKKLPPQENERASIDSVDLTQTIKEREEEITEHQEKDYDNEESEEINRDINQLVFVIHGIGQQMTERLTGQNLVHDVNLLRKTIKSTWPIVAGGLDNKYKESNGIQVLPILWRKGMLLYQDDKSKEEALESDIGYMNDDGSPTLEEITLEGAPNIRNIVADVFLDIPLYMTSKHHETMIRIVTKEINRVYKLFIERNPNFLKNNGQVTLFAHSLGSLLAFDILTAQPFPQQEQISIKKPLAATLDFPVKNFFAIGSPLGVLLLLRGEKVVSRRSLPHNMQQSNDVTFVYPAVDKIYNIFHKSDPVAYRLEPLVARHYGAQLKPVPIPYIKGGLKSMLDAGFTVGNDIASKASTMLESIKTGITSSLLIRGLGFSKPLDVAAGAYELNNSKQRSATDPNLMAERLASRSAAKLALLNSSGRLDYYIQEGLLENTYISALSVHMSYWQDVDVAGFLIRELYKKEAEGEKTIFV